ncbi:hypothetical protein [Streptomyces sp. NPDC001056]
MFTGLDDYDGRPRDTGAAAGGTVREAWYRGRLRRPGRPAGPRATTGEGTNGPDGRFGGCLAALDDCPRGSFAHTAPDPDVLAEDGMHVTPA